jgi:hypothetical protein
MKCQSDRTFISITNLEVGTFKEDERD